MAATPPARPTPEDFLELVERSKLGRLKVYLGYAAGVGKTYRMLEEAHSLCEHGVDAVLGYIEPHGRPETIMLLAGLETVPRRKVEYRGVVIEEMDLDAVIARHPDVAIVDEVPHTNVPGCKNERRYQDILDILAAGINVICAFNIQHLESLNDMVGRATGVTVRETVPDTFLKGADQIVSIDLAIEDLLDRLRAGKIYSESKVPSALAHFFKSDNLAALRELSLREVAENMGRQSTLRTGPWEAAAPSSVGERVLVCTSSNSPRAKMLLRRGSRLAGRLNTHWYVIYVETSREAPASANPEDLRHLTDTLAVAHELGAEVVHVKSDDPVTAILEFARGHGVGHIIVGRSLQPRWKRLFTPSFPNRLLDQAEGFDVHVVSFDEERRT